MGFPLLNGFVGEYLILLGTYQVHWTWAAWAATGVILSACYLLWAYQRVFFGEVTHTKNKELADTSAREKWLLVALAVVIIWMGVQSPFFTRRITASCKSVLQQMNHNVMHEAAAPSVAPTLAGGSAANAAQLSTERLAGR